LKANRLRLTTAALAAAAALGGNALAEDIDLFTSPAGGGTAPNILIMLDNSANWNRNDQAWPLGKQGEGELRALYTILGDAAVNESVNMGLMMFSSSNSPEDSAYVRFHVRNMTPANKQAFRDLIGDAACPPATNGLTGKKNCILRDFSSSSGAAGNAGNNSGEMTNSASTRYSGAMFEIFKYFGGYTDPPRAFLDEPGSPVSSTKFGPAFFSTRDLKFDPGAYDGSNYVSPIDINNSCAKNFVIFIGNGYPSQEASTTYLSGINGDPTVPPPIGTAKVIAANWAKYLFTTDVSPQPGRQNVYTYTINVFNAKEEIPQTTLMKAMAKYGGGRYFEANSEDEIIQALREIIIEIQSVNSVFASASLPINATNRSQNENQVFIGMFRPDSNAKPMWYGNLKEYRIALFGGDARLADAEGKEAIAASTGFLQACAVSDHTTPSGIYWDWSADSHGTCGTVANSAMSDYPDGGVVEKGGAAEVLRKGNDPSATAPFTVNRSMYTCAASCGSMVDFTSGTVTAARVGAADAIEHANIINFTRGMDVNNENAASSDLNAASIIEPRASIHGDIAHSRPLPVNFGGSRGVEIFYGANDGTFKAVKGEGGVELWSFVAPEHHGRLKRLYANTPPINYPPPSGVVGGQPKDYFFDGASGLLQNIDNSRVWIFPTMRRGGRMIYAFDITSPTPALMWARGCPNLGNDTGCSAGYDGIGQTWSAANVAYIKGQGPDDDPTPHIIMGGGYDSCLDTDAATTTCTASAKGRKLYVINAATGSIVASFATGAPVAADVTLIDRDFDGMVDHAYVADALGSVYRVDFSDPTTFATLPSGSWSITKMAETSSGNRKFLFGPAALAVGSKVYLALGSGDRERPLITNYPYTTPVMNRFYSFIDDFSGTALDLNGASMENFSADTDCDSILGTGKRGWFMDLAAGTGEQTVTSAVIFGGTVFFSTNRPTPTVPGSCGTNLGEARGYAVNLLNASGVIGTGKLCGGNRSGVFTGGGIPPSPVVGVVPITQPDGSVKPTNVLIGGVNLDTGAGSPIGAQEPDVPITQLRTRLYWYPHGDR
jgi:type IV pilus assembly protein PilY1